MKIFIFLFAAFQAIDPMMLMMMMNSNPNEGQAGQMNMMLPLLLADDDSKVKFDDFFKNFKQKNSQKAFFLENCKKMNKNERQQSLS